MMKSINSRAGSCLLALSTSMLLMACGSGNNTTTTPAVALVPGTDVPVAATQDSSAALNFVAMVVAKGEADTETPLTVGDAELSASDVVDPMPVAA